VKLEYGQLVMLMMFFLVGKAINHGRANDGVCVWKWVDTNVAV
jgi:hypothetical protein